MPFLMAGQYLSDWTDDYMVFCISPRKGIFQSLNGYFCPYATGTTARENTKKLFQAAALTIEIAMIGYTALTWIVIISLAILGKNFTKFIESMKNYKYQNSKSIELRCIGSL